MAERDLTRAQAEAEPSPICAVPDCGQAGEYESKGITLCSRHKSAKVSAPAPGEGAEAEWDALFAEKKECLECKAHPMGDWCPEHYAKAKKLPSPVEDGKRGALPAALQAGADFIGDAVALAQFAKDHPEVNAQDCVGVWLGTDAVAHLHAVASLESMRKALGACLEALPVPDHTGSLVMEKAKKGIGEAEPLGINKCSCSLHTAHRLVRAALAEAGGAA